jgi:spore coat protein CotH
MVCWDDGARCTIRCGVVVATVVVLSVVAQSAGVYGQAPGYANLYNPLQVLTLDLQMDPADWTAIKNDASYSIGKPTYFWADGENKIAVSVRRKPTEAVGDKVSLKIDVNEYFNGLQWRGVKKLSLENGYGSAVVSEGFAWYLHRAAATVHPGYTPPRAAWVNVRVNGQLLGVYTSVEQPAKTFLRNHDLWVPNHSWLYKQGDIGSPELDAGSGSSPAYATLTYLPFNEKGPAPPAGYATQMQSLINMDQMLTVGAVKVVLQ